MVDLNNASERDAYDAQGGLRRIFCDEALGYSRWSDDKYRMVVLRFDKQPPPDILEALGQGGFMFCTVYGELRSVWYRLNSEQGKIEVENIEGLLGITAHRAGAVAR